jgi:hypothetical protein
MSGTIIESSEFHTQMHSVVEGALNYRELKESPTYTVRPTDLEIIARFPGEKYGKGSPGGFIIESPVLKREMENQFVFKTDKYGNRKAHYQFDSYGNRQQAVIRVESLISRHTLPLHKIAQALRQEIGDEMACKLGEEYKLARQIAKRPANELGEWGGLYVTSALFLEHHRAQEKLEGDLFSCRHERDRINRLNNEHDGRVRLARESGNTYLENGLRVAPNQTPNYPIDRVIDAARDTVVTNAQLMPGFESSHKVEPTKIRPVDQVLALNGLLARPKKSSGDESALSAFVNRLFGGKSR